MTNTTPEEYADKSGSITSGGTAQDIMAANVNRRGWWFYNSSAIVLYVNDKITAVATTAIAVQPGALLSTEPNEEVSKAAISVLGATTAATFVAREW